jgi:DNA-binding GntR family transcriptional regulator
MQRRHGDQTAESLSEAAYRMIEELIVTQRLRPGSMLSENGLREQLGCGRTPVREALQRLAASGLVISRGRQGLQVSQLSLADLLDAFSVVAELEGLAAAQAARRMQPGQKLLLEQAHEECIRASESGDEEFFYDANIRFHETVAEASHNRILQEELRRLTLKISPYRRTITYQPGRVLSSIPEHKAIMDAILAGDTEKAHATMRKHVTLLGEGLPDLLHFLPMVDN